jgi:hypothetical protein
MANLFWVGGSTAYDGVTNRLATTSGGAASVAVIAAADTVTFDTNSGAAAVTTSANISCTTMTFSAGFTGSLTMSNTLTVSGTFTINQGTLNTNGQTCSFGQFNYGNATARTVTFGSSAITVTNTSTAFTGTAVTNLTVTANTATVTATGVATTANLLNLSTKNWNGLSFVITGGTSTNVATISSAGASVNNLTITGTASQTDTYSFNGSLTVTGTFTVNGNSAVNRVVLQSSTLGTARTITAAATSLSNLDYADITGAGAATWAITSGVAGDRGGNSVVTTTTPATQTRDSTSGSAWSVAARWTSRVPLPQDNVVINGSSGNISATDVLVLGKDIDFTGYTGTITQTTNASAYEIFGSLTASSGMSFGAAVNTFSINYRGRGSHTLTCNGKTLFPASSNAVHTVNTAGGTYTLADAYTMSSTAAMSFNIISGTFDSSSYNITTGRLVTSGSLTRSITLGTTIFSLGANSVSTIISIATSGLTWSGSSATFNITSTTTNTRTLDLQNQPIGTFTYTVANTGQLTLSSAATFSTAFAVSGAARTVQFLAGATYTIPSGSGWQVNGTAGNLITIQSSSAGSAATISCAFGTASSDYLSLKDSAATGGASFFAGANTTNVSGNTGWTFSAPTNAGDMLLVF